MRLAALLRLRRRLLMQLDSPTSQPSLKRPFAQQAFAYAQPPASEPSSAESHRPVKAQKIDGSDSAFAHPNQPPSRPSIFSPAAFDMPSSSSRSAFGSRSSRPTLPASKQTKAPASSRNSKRGGGRGKGSPLATLEGPLCDEAYIKKTYAVGPPLARSHEENPKSPLANFCSMTSGNMPTYVATEGLVGRDKVFRVTVTVEVLDQTIVGQGDHGGKKEAEKLAALSACYQLEAKGLLSDPKRARSAVLAPPTVKVEATLSDGSAITYDLARQFIDYYCRRYNFGKEDVTLEEPRSRKGRSGNWEAVMTVGERRIGIGSGTNKKAATIACYLDVVQYLESCDNDLWKTFMEAAKTGKDLGMAPRVLFQMTERLDDEIRDLCYDIKKSSLYKNRPSSNTGAVTEASQVPRYRRPAPFEYLADKSQRLLQRRQQYLANPAMETMRKTRASLPVYTKSEDLRKHIRQNEVTICMAATGSGKTTQIPQIILDEWIEQGHGSKCNIICTQPRRLAAISVADRVAKERGEVVGRGSVGYQVRFEAKLPEEHGSITFCTTGIFLKRMQSALLEGGSANGQSLDDVTHVVVDEVHERDVDTDLLLVVLKRLLADRKAKNKPLKIVLMSATIDPTLFQQYFPDANGKPASVIEIPGRSYPVEKSFLDDYLPEIAQAPDARMAFNDPMVVKYLQNELEPAALRSVGLGYGMQQDSREDTDLPMPYPLIALTIAHVLRRSDDGHVLVFLPGWEEIMAVQRLLTDGNMLGVNFRDSSKHSIHLLHSTIPLAEQQVIFEPPPPGVRRIILATNIAETSITIPDVVYVVDTGKIKEQRYDPERHMSSLVSAWVGSSNLNQRAGRAGRHRAGNYFGVMSKRRADGLHAYQTVEMKRVDLSNVVMHVKALNFPGMTVEEVLAATIEPPASERVAAAMKDLQMAGALDEQKNLTSLGRVLLQLPVEAHIGRLVLFGSFFRCLDQALTLAAILTNRDPFLSPMQLKVQASAIKNSWSPTEFRSDPLAVLRAFNEWWKMQGRGDYAAANRFSSDNFLSKPTLLMIQKIKGHLLQSLHHAGVLDVSAGGNASLSGVGMNRRGEVVVPPELNTNGESLPLLVGLIAIASQPKFAIRTGERSYRTQQDKMAMIHPSSVNHRKREIEGDNSSPGEKQIFAFNEKRQNVSVVGKGNAEKYLMTTTRLDPMTYVLFGAYNITVTARGLDCDGWLPIVGNIDALDDIQRMKYLMESCMLRVFEGITYTRHRQQSRAGPARIVAAREEKEDESDDDDDVQSRRDRSLSSTEIKELDMFSQDLVRILNRYSEERIASQSRHNSRPGTPMGSPSYGLSRLPSLSGGRSGQSTPYGSLSAHNSRPGTPGPSPLSRRL